MLHPQTPQFSWSTRLRSTINGVAPLATHDSDQENDTESSATADIRGIITAADIEDRSSTRKSLTESPVKISELSGQLGNVAAGLVSAMWPAEESAKNVSLSTIQSPTSCLSVLASKNLRTRRARIIQNGRITKSIVRKNTLVAGVLSYCKHASRQVRKGYHTRAHVRAALSRSKS